MKKIIFFTIVTFISLFANAQYEDALLRSAGFFISPAITSFTLPKETIQPNPRFGLTLGFRYKNELSKGFFLEGGFAIAGLGTQYQAENDTMWDYWTGTPNIFFSQTSVTHINLTTPFLAGYRTSKGKVRFEAAAGICFNLKILKYEKTFAYSTYSSDDNIQKTLRPSFGTGFSAMARAGISVPIGDRATVDILPTLRYQFCYFTAEDLDVTQSIFTDEQKWSVGLDVGITWKLDDAEKETDNQEVKKETNGNDYTFNYQDTTTKTIVKPKRTKSSGKKNFAYLELAGNGLILSQNYERTVFRQGIVSIQARAGFGMIPHHYFIPFGVNVALGKNRKKFEMGIGATVDNLYDDPYFTVNIVPSLAYRYESRGHFFLRLALMSHYFVETGELTPGLGVSIGGCF